MTEIMPVPRNLILLSYQQGAFLLVLYAAVIIRFFAVILHKSLLVYW